MTSMNQVFRINSAKAAYATIGDHEYYFRSTMERNYARWLEYQKVNGFIHYWSYEPHTFWFEKIKRGVRSYKPDFLITRNDGSCYYVEVKGYMDPKSKTKLARFKKYYPDEEIQLVDNKWFKSNKDKLFFIISDME